LDGAGDTKEREAPSVMGADVILSYAQDMQWSHANYTIAKLIWD